MTRIYKHKEELVTALIPENASVLDVGFYGQGTGPDTPGWVHARIASRPGKTFGIDLEYDEHKLPAPEERYARMSAESFSLPERFDRIFAGDLIEHLSNPGLFLTAARAHLAPEGALILTTPNTFNLFNLAEKLTKEEPTVNSDHTMYFNRKTLTKLLEKNGFEVSEVSYLYTLGCTHQESFKKKILNVLYNVVSWCTPKFMETLVVVARPRV